MTDNGSPEDDASAPESDRALSFLLGGWRAPAWAATRRSRSFRSARRSCSASSWKPYLIYTTRSWRLDDDGDKVEPLASDPASAYAAGQQGRGAARAPHAAWW